MHPFVLVDYIITYIFRFEKTPRAENKFLHRNSNFPCVCKSPKLLRNYQNMQEFCPNPLIFLMIYGKIYSEQIYSIGCIGNGFPCIPHLFFYHFNSEESDTDGCTGSCVHLLRLHRPSRFCRSLCITLENEEFYHGKVQKNRCTDLRR